MRTRALNALSHTRFERATHPVIFLLTDYAAQNPGLEFANYGERASYRRESRNILADWQRVRAALVEAAALDLTDAHILAAMPRAFSGRLKVVATCSLWSPRQVCDVAGHEATPPDCPALAGYRLKDKSRPEWSAIMAGDKLSFAVDYCTGQYWPTEYRKAVASVLETACHAAKQDRPKVALMPRSLSELKERNAQNGGCWFDRSSMRFFGTRIESGILQGRYFITSEQPPHGSRKFTVRTFNALGEVDTVGEFCHWADKEEARALGLGSVLDKIKEAHAAGFKMDERADGRWIVLDQPKGTLLYLDSFGNEWEAAIACLKQKVLA